MAGQTKKVPDWWDLPSLNNMAAERTGYPTQKPLALLERLVGAHTRPGELVLDPCCGSGTTLVAAHRLGRRFVGIDCGELAIETTLMRLAAEDCVPRVQEAAGLGGV
jgi:site-specific DNA-methyltransferase (adenine-specific)